MLMIQLNHILFLPLSHSISEREGEGVIFVVLHVLYHAGVQMADSV